MKGKYIFILCLIVALFSIASVSASENINETIQTEAISIDVTEDTLGISLDENEDALGVSEDEVLTAGGNWYVNASADDGGDGSQTNPYKDFKSVLENDELQDGDTVYFAGGVYGTSNGLIIQKKLNLVNWNDDEVIFDGQNHHIWDIRVDEFNITGLTFKNGNSGAQGGALYFSHGLKNSIINATFTDNTGLFGGAICITPFDGQTSITNCTFDGKFINNKAVLSSENYGGGAICIVGAAYDSKFIADFINNTASGESNGGAVFIQRLVSNVNFTGDYINNSAFFGGAISFADIKNSNISATFVKNIARENGGAIHIAKNIENIQLNTTFENNSAVFGGAIFFNTNPGIVNGKYINNDAYRGGAIYINQFINSIISADFINNYATNSGGAIYINNEFQESTILGNFINNTAKTGAAIGGQGMYPNAEISANFINNTADIDEAYAIIDFNVGNGAQIDSSLFINNTASYIINIKNYYGDFDVTNNIFLNYNVVDTFAVYDDFLNPEYNWYGNNATNYENAYFVRYELCDNWLFLNATATPKDIEITKTSDIVFKLSLYNKTNGEISDYDNSLLPKVNLTVTSTNGDVDKEIIALEDTVTFTPTKAGTASVTASVENAYYTIEIEITKLDPELSVESDERDYAENTTIALNYNNTATGTVNIKLTGKIRNYTFSDIKINETILLPESILPDEYEVSVVYSGDYNFTNATAEATLTINKLDIGGELSAYNITVNEINATMFKVIINRLEFESDYDLFIGGNGSYYNKPIEEDDQLILLVLNKDNPAGQYSFIFKIENSTIYNDLDLYGVSNVTKLNPNLSVESDVRDYAENTTIALNYNNTATGTVNITLTGKIRNYTFNDIKINETILLPESILPDEYEVSVVYSGDYNFTNVTAEATLTINKLDIDGELSAYNIAVNEINATMFKLIFNRLEFDSDYDIFIGGNGSYYNKPIEEDDQLILLVLNKDNPAGQYSFIFKIENSTIYNDLDLYGVSNVTKLNPNLSVESYEKDFTAETVITLNYNNTATGTVNITLSGKIHNFTFNDIEINETILLDGFIYPDVYEVSVVYSGDYNFTNATAEATLTINKLDINMEIFGFDINVDDINATMFMVIIPEFKYMSRIDREINITDGNYETNISEDGSTWYILNGGNPAGKYTLKITFKNSAIYNDVSGNATSNILKLNITPEIAVDNYTVNVTVPGDVSGNLTLTIANRTLEVPVENGTAVFDISDIPDGDYNATLTFDGDDKYNGFEEIVPVLIETEPYFIVEDLIKFYKGPERLNVTVYDSKGNPKANVEVKISINGVTYTRTTDSDGIASLAINLDSDIYSAEITVGNESKNVTVAVLPTIVGSDVDKVFNDNTTYDVSVADSEGNPLEKGTTVQFNINGVFYTADVNDKGVANLDIPLPVGDYIVTAINPVTGENTANNITVNKADSEISIETFNITVDDTGALFANITLPKYATGEVLVSVNGMNTTQDINNETVDIVGDYAYMPVNNKGLSAGDYNITVTLIDDNYNSSTATGSFTVSKLDLDILISQNNNILTVNVPEDAEGNITLMIANETLSAPIENGSAVFDLTALPDGEYNATLSYSGDDKYNGYEANTSVSIGSDKPVITAPDLIKYYHGPEVFTVNVSTSKGSPIANQTVQITINGVTYTKITNESGIAYLSINLNSGEYETTVVVNDTTITSKVTVLSTVNGTDLKKVFRSSEQYYATFRNSDGTYLKEGTSVEFNVHGVIYTRQVSGDKGLAKLNINLEQGEYIITATNLITGEMSSNNITVIPRIIENKDTVLYYRNGTQFTAKIIDDDMNVAGAGIEVKFNIHGVFYARTTDENGMVSLNINLDPGEYIITTECKGCQVSNTIKVLPVLTAKDISMKVHDGTKYTAKLVDGQGKALSGQKISTNINGRLFETTTNSNGEISINLDNLPAGEYHPTSVYNVNKAYSSSKITISS